MQLTTQSNGKIADIDHFLYFAEAFLEAFSHFVAHEGTEVGFVNTQCIANLPHNFSAFGGGSMSPSFECLSGNVNHLVVCLAIGELNFGDCIAVNGGGDTASFCCLQMDPLSTSAGCCECIANA